MFSWLKKTETAIIVLVAISLVAITVYRLAPCEYSIRPGNGWIVDTTDDRVDGGNSIAVDRSDESCFSAEFDMQAGAPNPFGILMVMPPEEMMSSDFSWMESVALTAHIEGRDVATFRLHILNFEDESEDREGDHRYNEMCFSLTPQQKTLTINRDRFFVPGWWLEQKVSRIKNPSPCFDRTAWLEFTTGNVIYPGKYRLVVDEIKLTGHWISPALFYRSILGMWLAFGTLVAIIEIARLKRRLTLSKTVEINLLQRASHLNKLATADPLTKLLNRRGMREHVTKAMDKLLQDGEPLSLILFDIDHFKKLNDEHGHTYGDDVLIKIAQLTGKVLTNNEPIARWGGEEFIVVCRDASLQQAAEIAELLRERIERDIGVTCSFGVTSVHPDVKFADAIRAADACLYRAKDAGRNCVEIASEVANKTRPIMTNEMPC